MKKRLEQGPRRKPRRGTVKVAGRNFTKDTAEVIDQVAQQRGQSPNAVIVDVLEGWAKRVTRRESRPPKGRGGRPRQGP